jgi:conjugal transfer/entry exclusion protein
MRDISMSENQREFIQNQLKNLKKNKFDLLNQLKQELLHKEKFFQENIDYKITVKEQEVMI